jgi:hypothetical protein
MLAKFNNILYNFDIIGPNPQLYIFNNNRYKTLLSFIISIIIILFSVFFTIFSLVQYFKFENPIFSYTKGNDKNTNREFLLKDTFLMFQLIDSTSIKHIDESVAYFESTYKTIFDNGKVEEGSLKIEKCELGKNIDIKFKDFIIGKSNFGRPLEEFYCFSPNNGNLSLFYYPDVCYNIIDLQIVFKNNTLYIPEKIQSLIVSENNLIDHNNKSNPLSNSFEYHPTPSFSSSQFTTVNYNFQFIKYESDEGYFYRNSRNFIGISFSDMTFFNSYNENYNIEKKLKEENKINIGTIEFSLNRSNFDSYKRTYQKLQSLLAEIMSVISLIFEIGRQISAFLCEKNMSKDIIQTLINRDQKHLLRVQSYRINKLCKTSENIKTTSIERKNTQFESVDMMNNKLENSERIDKNKLNISKNDLAYKNEKIKQIEINNNHIDKVNYFHILKSYFCFKDKKTEMINLCNDIITEDMCVERILERFYNLEKLSHHYSGTKTEKIKINKNRGVKGPKKLIKDIDNTNMNDLKNEKIFSNSNSIKLIKNEND